MFVFVSFVRDEDEAEKDEPEELQDRSHTCSRGSKVRWPRFDVRQLEEDRSKRNISGRFELRRRLERSRMAHQLGRIQLPSRTEVHPIHRYP